MFDRAMSDQRGGCYALTHPALTSSAIENP
jgi:hypothetical protein